MKPVDQMGMVIKENLNVKFIKIVKFDVMIPAQPVSQKGRLQNHFGFLMVV
ncbi:MAG: hypothetical protein AAGC65_26090 [Mucilaginibacter sp.]|uniref:hypothetical protein n=1 Tax=Mucilaginibacter sp. TaxID=1882438 RepID=UPI0031A5110F